MNHHVTNFLFCSRDDQELFTGDFVSKIIVPHPALNFPKKVTITYQVYRGWLTRGLSQWTINKVVLSDSFGESYSLCKHFKLESGKPQRMTLKHGDCHEEELNLLALKAKQEALTKTESTTTSPQGSSEDFTMFNITGEVIELGKHIPLDRNTTESTSTTTTTTETSAPVTSSASWKPMITSSSTDNINVSASNASSDDEGQFLNIGERLPKKAKTEKRSFDEGEDDLLMTREDSADMDESGSEDAMADEAIDNKFVTVQLFQYRLGDVFEKAEKYARFTLFPLLTEQISNIFNFDASEKDDLTSNDGPIVINKAMSNNLRKYDQEEDVNVRSLQTMGMQLSDHIKPIEKLFHNYDIKKEQKSQREKKDVDNVRIHLPTYRPEVSSSEKVFIPIERDP